MPINRTILEGRLTHEPELKATTNGTSVIRFGVAVQRPYAGKDGERKTDFINCIAYRQTAEFVAKYFKKGDPIEVEGSIVTSNYEDKDGNKRTSVEVSAQSVGFVSTPSGYRREDNANAGNAGGNPAAAVPPAQPEPSNADFESVDDDDLPF